MLKLSNLHVGVENKEILKGVSLRIKEGEIHTLMGPNGSGKSTLASALMGHPAYKAQGSRLPASSAGRRRGDKAQGKSQITNYKLQITLDGKSLLNLKPDERARLGLFLAFQTPLAIPGVSVRNFLITAYKNIKKQKVKSKNANQKVKNILEINQILEEKCDQLEIKKDFLRKSLNEGFSGGEKKKIEMLQMLVLKPKYAIVDEIDTGLDVDALKTIAKGVKKLAQEGTGILLITHYQRILKHLKPDFVHVMIEGRIVKSGGEELAKEIERRGYKRILHNFYEATAY